MLEIFNFYGSLYYNNQKKVTRNKFTPVIFNFYDLFYYNNQKK